MINPISLKSKTVKHLFISSIQFLFPQATGGQSGFSYAKLLSDAGFSDADLSLLAWLQSIPFEVFSCPFEQVNSEYIIESQKKRKNKLVNVYITFECWKFSLNPTQLECEKKNEGVRYSIEQCVRLILFQYVGKNHF